MAIPFWVLGHIHLSLNVYQDLHEIIVSFGLNILVLIGFIIDYKENAKYDKHQLMCACNVFPRASFVQSETVICSYGQYGHIACSTLV